MAAQPFLFPFLLHSLFFFKRQTTCREIRISRGKSRAPIGRRNTSASPPTGFDTFCTARRKSGGSALKGEARLGPGAARGANEPPPSLPPARQGGVGGARQILTLGWPSSHACRLWGLKQQTPGEKPRDAWLGQVLRAVTRDRRWRWGWLAAGGSGCGAPGPAGFAASGETGPAEPVVSLVVLEQRRRGGVGRSLQCIHAALAKKAEI